MNLTRLALKWRALKAFGTWRSVPLEVATFGWRPEALYLEALGATVRLHRGDDGPVFRTDQGSKICPFASTFLISPTTLAARSGCRP